MSHFKWASSKTGD